MECFYSKWFSDNGDSTHRLNYNLNEDSLVFDVGGYFGNWSKSIFDKYNCNILIFEPIEKYYNIISNKFSNNPKVKIFNFGLSHESCRCKISLGGDSSSIFHAGVENFENIELVDINQFIHEHEIKFIDLMKLNVEGCEYHLLESLIDNNNHTKIENIQVQFHTFIPKCEQRRNRIHTSLEKTHHLTYCYPFVWENWELNDKTSC